MNDCSASRSSWKTDVGPMVSRPSRLTLIAIMVVVCKPGLVSPVLSPDP